MTSDGNRRTLRLCSNLEISDQTAVLGNFNREFFGSCIEHRKKVPPRGQEAADRRDRVPRSRTLPVRRILAFVGERELPLLYVGEVR